MKTRALAYRKVSKEAIIVLAVLAYAFYHYSIVPLLAEHIDVELNRDTSAEPLAGEAAKTTEEGQWKIVESSYFIIHYRPDADLGAIEKKMQKRKFYFGARRMPAGISDPAKRIAYRFDILHSRAREILGMNPRNMEKIKVKIFKSRKSLGDEYFRIFGKRKNYKAFYIYKYNTIYATEEDTTDSVMAHEIGHAVVDHYFVVRPSEKIRELLATYVDFHLDD